MIPIADLVVGNNYRGEGRNFDTGVWDGERFLGQRTKFGATFTDGELHYEADPHYGTFKPMEVLND